MSNVVDMLAVRSSRRATGRERELLSVQVATRRSDTRMANARAARIGDAEPEPELDEEVDDVRVGRLWRGLWTSKALADRDLDEVASDHMFAVYTRGGPWRLPSTATREDEGGLIVAATHERKVDMGKQTAKATSVRERVLEAVGNGSHAVSEVVRAALIELGIARYTLAALVKEGQLTAVGKTSTRRYYLPGKAPASITITTAKVASPRRPPAPKLGDLERAPASSGARFRLRYLSVEIDCATAADVRELAIALSGRP